MGTDSPLDVKDVSACGVSQTNLVGLTVDELYIEFWEKYKEFGLALEGLLVKGSIAYSIESMVVGGSESDGDMDG